MEIKVSIIMPAYNAAPYIGAAIESVLAQIYTVWELIVVDDGSTDDTLAIAQHYAEQDKRIQVYHQQNQGGCVARNIALAYAKGNYIQFLDADDLLHSDKITKQMQVLKDYNYNPQILVYGGCRSLAGDKELPTPMDFLYRDYKPAYQALVEIWNYEFSSFPYSGYLIHRDIIQQVGGWDTQLARSQDSEYMARIIGIVDAMLYTPDAYFLYRQVHNSVSRRNPSLEQIKSEYRVADSISNVILSHDNSVTTRRICEKYYSTILCKYYPTNRELVDDVLNTMKQKGLRLYFGNRGKKFRLLRIFFGWRIATLLLNK